MACAIRNLKMTFFRLPGVTPCEEGHDPAPSSGGNLSAAATALTAARDHTLGASIVSGDLAASPEVSLQAGFAYSIAYFKVTWQTLLLTLALGAGIEVLLPRARLSQFFAGWKGSLRATGFAIPSMMCHMLRRSDCSRDDRLWCRRVLRTSLLAR
jgi:hypothetical protein